MPKESIFNKLALLIKKMNNLNYSETIDYLFTRLPMFQRTGPAAYKNSLATTLLLDEYYGHPHSSYKVIHVAGTNGKGSVSHMLASILQAAGYKTGLYTSPHLKDFRERIRVDGRMMEKEAVVRWVDDYKERNKTWKLTPSFFELTVAMAFDYFASQEVEVAVVEVGLGGRLDSTNIVVPELSIITNIGLDHTALLGDSVEKIALEKAGIIKSGVPVVVGTSQEETAPVFNETALSKGSPVLYADQEYNVRYAMLSLEGRQVLNVEREGDVVYENLELGLRGAYQLRNLPAVLNAVDVLIDKEWNISRDNVYEGLSQVVERTGILGRWQVVGSNPMIICDTGHNEDGIRLIVEQLGQMAYKELHIVLGVVADKNPDPVLGLLPKNANYYFAKADIERAMDAGKLRDSAMDFGLGGVAYRSVREAFRAARERAGKHDLILVGGSTFVVSEIL